MSKLSMYGELSAGRREENISRVFAYLNTRREFNPSEIKDKVSVTPKTVLSYLETIQEAQLLQREYQEHVLRPFHEQVYSNVPKSQKLFAKRQHELWNIRLEKVLRLPSSKFEEKEKRLAQFRFEDTTYHIVKELYMRLEQSLLFYGYIVAPKSKK